MRWSIHTEKPTSKLGIRSALSVARDAELGGGTPPAIAAKLADIDDALISMAPGAARTALEAARAGFVSAAASAPGIKDPSERTAVGAQMSAAIDGACAALEASDCNLPVNISISGATDRQDEDVAARFAIYFDFLSPSGKPKKEPTTPQADPFLSGATVPAPKDV